MATSNIPKFTRSSFCKGMLEAARFRGCAAINEEQRAGFVRGLRTCVQMLEGMDVDECSIADVTPDVRRGRAQDNAVLRTLRQVLKRGDSNELEGFCAALTDIVATADDQGDFYRMFSRLAEVQIMNPDVAANLRYAARTYPKIRASIAKLQREVVKMHLEGEKAEPNRNPRKYRNLRGRADHQSVQGLS